MELPYWALDPERLFEKLSTSAGGLTAKEAAVRHSLYKPYSPGKKKIYRALGLLFSQLASPFILRGNCKINAKGLLFRGAAH